LIERRRLYKSALLSIPGQIVAQDCWLRDFTVKGAGIRLNGITLLPLTFELWAGGQVLRFRRLSLGDAATRSGTPAGKFGPGLTAFLGRTGS
jgi:hypothetical protein